MITSKVARSQLIVFVPPLVLLGLWWIVGALSPLIMDYLRARGSSLPSVLPDLTFVSTPPKAVLALIESVLNGTLFTHSVATIGKTLLSFVLAAIIGGAFGLTLATSRWFERAMIPTVEAIRSIPPIALLPLFILIAGVGSSLAVVFALFGTLWPITIATYSGAKQVDPLIIDVGRNLGLTQRQLLRHIILPLSLPGYLTGLRIALPLSFILVIVAEMFVGGGVGLGAELNFAKRTFRFDDMMGLVLAISAFGFLLNWVLVLMERRVLWWDPRFRPQQ